jgi:hypothetical protein
VTSSVPPARPFLPKSTKHNLSFDAKYFNNLGKHMIIKEIDLCYN